MKGILTMDMKKIIKCVRSFYFIFLLFPMPVIAGELIEADCTWEGGKFLFFVETGGGKQNVLNKDYDVTFPKDKVMLTPNTGHIIIVDFKNGIFYKAGKKLADCKFSNLEALKKKNTTEAVVENKMDVTCRISEGSSKPDIWFSGIIGGTFNKSNYGEEGKLSVTATVSGNNNTAKFSRQTNYKKIGNRLEIRETWLTVAATMEQFNEHFGVFPDLKCTSP